MKYSGKDILDSIAIGAVVVLILAGSLAWVYFNREGGEENLTIQGYTDIEREGFFVSPFDCPWTYKYATGFKANKDGKEVHGVICSATNIKLH